MKTNLLRWSGLHLVALLSLLTTPPAARAVNPSCTAPPAGLVSWWSAEGNATDLIGGNHGTLLNDATFATGEVGQGFSFDGVNDLVKIPRSANLDGGSQITIEFWMKASPGNAMNSYQGLVTSDFYGIEIANGYALGPLGVNFFISTDGGASVSPSSYPDTATVNGGGAVVSAGVWHHVAGTYDGAKLQLYLDGQPWGSPNYHTGAISPMLTNSFVAIGAEDGRTICPSCVSSRYFNGQIDEPAIYNRALAASEILAIYNAGSAGKCPPTVANTCVTPPPGMVGWWKADGNANDTVGDNHGVLQNVSYTNGVVNQAFHFDPYSLPYGTYSGAQFADRPAYVLTNSLSIEAWARPRGDGYFIFFRGDHRPGLDPYYLCMQANSTVRFGITDDNGNPAYVEATLPYHQWTHVAGTLDGGSGTLRLYTNGTLAAQITTTVRPMGNLIAGESPGVGIGNLNEGGNNFPYAGDIDEVALFNRALSLSEIQSIYTAGSAGKCPPVVATNNCVTPPPGMVGWWPGAGNATDAISGLNATLQGGATYAPGKVGQGFRFDGTNGYVQIPDSAALKPANVTCEAWVWLDPSLPVGRGGEQIVFKKNTWSAWFEGYGLSKGTIDMGGGISSERFQFVVSRFGNQVIINSQTVAQRGVWYHVAATYDGNQSKLYVNGVLEATATPGFALDYDTTPIFIGTSGTWVPYLSMFGGIIDEPTIYNRALSASELAAIYTAASAGKCSPTTTTTTNCVAPPANLAAWWPGNGNTSELIQNLNGTLAGGATYTNAIVGQGFHFDGVSGRVTVPNSPSLNFGAGEDLSIECWIKAFPNSNPSNVRSIVEKRNGAENYRGYTLFLWDGFLALQLSQIDVGINYFSGGADLRDGVFHHVAASVQRNSTTGGHLYVDGQLIYTFDPTGVSGDLSNADVLRLGQHAAPGDGSYFPGVIDDVAIYRRALSTTEIQSIYTAGSAGKCGGSGTVSCTDVPAGLVTWLRAEGNFNDSTLRNNGMQSGGVVFTNGEVGQGLFFNGATEVKLSASPTLDVGAGGGLTLETWLRPGHIDLYVPQIVLEWNDGNGNIGGHLSLSTDHGVYGDGFGNVIANLVDIHGGSHALWTASDLVLTNALSHVAFTYDKISGNAAIYVNGLLATNANLGSFTPQTSYDFYLGNRVSGPFAGHHFNGVLDETSIYNRALAASEIQAIYTAGSAGKCLASLLVAPVLKTQPVNQTITAGNAVTFTALAEGTAPLSYQWQFNGTNLSGATNTSLTLLNVQLNQAGNYSVLVSNAVDHLTSSNALLTVNPAACVLPPAGLVSWWRAESNVLDSVTGNQGTLEGGATFANGKTGRGFLFDGTSGYVQIPDSATLKPANVTIEAWVWLDPNVTTKPTTESIIFKRNSWSYLFEGYTIAKSDVDNGDGTYSSRFFSVISRNGNQVVISSTTVAQRGVWYHVAATYDGNTLTLFVNGVAEASASPGFALDYGDRPVFLGSTGEPEPYRSMLAGVIDEAAIYSRALSPNEIAGIYNASSASKCDAPIAPSIVQQPQDTAVMAGTSATFNVVAAGSAPLAYQWFANAVALPDETNATLTLNNIVYPMSGSLYSVTITNDGGSITSRNAVLSVPNSPPQITNPGSQIVNYTAPPLDYPFMVVDGESLANNLQLYVDSSNTNLVPNAQVILSGSGNNRFVKPTAIANLTGSTVITLTVVDEGGLSNSVSFSFTVINNSPGISAIAAQHGPLNGMIGPVNFTVSDTETPADQLVVAATTSNNNIVPTNQIVLGGSGASRTVTILPGTNSLGTANVTITVTDILGATSSRVFAVTWDQFADALAGLPALQYSAVAWGDYDNDGKLDLLVSGTTNGVQSGAVTRVYHNDNGSFTNFISLPGLFKCALAWNDYDRDGRLDIAISGLNSTNQAFSRIYHNNGNGTFTDLNAGLTGCYAGSVAWGDFNSDGAPDLFLCGLFTTTNGTVAVSTNLLRLYRNDGGGAFTDINLDLRTPIDNRVAAPNNGTAAWGDFDNDGRPDLLLVGTLNGVASVGTIYRNLGNGSFSSLTTTSFGGVLSSSAAWGDYDNDGWLDFAVFNSSGAASAVYRNNRNNTFTLAASNFAGVSGPQIAWGDYNNDGYLDLLVGNSVGSIAKLYRNNGNGTFADTLSTTLPATSNGALAWGDYNNDGNLDTVFLGSKSTLMRNAGNVTNTPPAAPANLAATPGATNSVVLTWLRPLDSQTKSNGLNYNLRVGTTQGGVDIVSPLADPFTGQRRVAALGNVGPTNRALLVNLPKGTYYWSVQAIDTAFAGSAFPGAPTAVDGTFTITNARPVISDIADLAIAPNTNTPGPTIPFDIGDLETFAGDLTITVRSSNTNVVATNNIVITRGVPSANYPSNCAIRVTARTNGISVITVTVTDASGAFASDNFTVTAEQFSLQSSNFVQVQNSLIAWGDYNNDGRLDVLIAGNTNSLLTFPVTQLYRNDGNGIFTPVASGLPNVTLGSAAWGDVNNDGWLDLVLTGTSNAKNGLTSIYRNNGDGTFTDIGAGLPGAYNSAVAWGDYDNDGRLDLLLSGTTNGIFSGAITRIYHNNGNGTFSNAVSLVGISLGSVAWSDLDGDGDLDIVLAGQSTSGAGTLMLYRNNGGNAFTQVSVFNGVYNCSLAVADFNNDGLPDVFLTGYSGSYLSLLYRNAGNFSFVSTQTGLPGARYASVAAGDYDNDGKSDILISGTTTGLATSGMTRIYRNTTTVPTAIEFNQLAATLPTNYLGAVTWADFNNDGRLDVMITGVPFTLLTSGQPSQTLLYRNNNNLTNTPPTAPASISAVRSNNIVSLAWAKATDAQTTNANGLKYQIRVGTNSGGIQIESPLADLNTGYRRVVQTGDASTNRWQLANLPPGNYFWSVQAIDTAFAGSPFAPENSFVVSSPLVLAPDSISTPVNTPLNFLAAKLTLNDLSPDGYPLTVIAVSTNGSNGGRAILVAGRIQYTAASPTVTGNDLFTYTVTDGVGGFASSNFTVTVGNGGTVSLNIVSGPLVDGSDFVVRFAGIPGFTYTVEAAATLGGPWTKVGNLTAPTTDTGYGIGVFEFREPMNSNTSRFYRTVYPAY